MKLFILALVASIQLGCSMSAVITQQEFNSVLQRVGSPQPAADIYPNFARATADFTREEIAMLLAQLIHESGGFRYREEIVCTTGNHCEGLYKDDIGRPNKNYYGRGFIQLTWGRNYRDASRALNLGDYLLDHPEVVAQDTKVAMDTSVWYWKDRVRPELRKSPNQFGATTRAINGPIECSKGPNERAQNRYKIYQQVADVLNIRNRASENGCYN
ncbi:endochitinase At2g43610-like [Copidosoma floridanum]|uniref:endochitinase At2g43610-like n=1 Tax=Copidosoma floridanum TaxID=29053 RepID=UPI0006C9AB0B|nr:endochitinase At2g43610-like [Copidosoma floridanum]